jgi:small subunit ribosomal protein S20
MANTKQAKKRARRDAKRRLRNRYHLSRMRTYIRNLKKMIQAKKSKRARDQVREADGTNLFIRFEQMLHRVDRMVAEAELARARNTSLDKEFTDLETDDELEAELAELKGKSGKKADVAA